jgi:beta-phosphoglucomutase-like phosphatase (HAD superfamily)
VTTDNPRGVLFDMDGTIIDSEPYWMAAERELVEESGGTWSTEQGLQLVGGGLWNTAKLLKEAGVGLSADDIVQRLSQRVLEQVAHSIPWRPGVRGLFRELLDANIPCALVTMSLRMNADALAQAVERELGQPVFSAVVGGDDVVTPKPDPEAYLLGAQLLGVDVADCVALEDSSFGASSAFTAGAVTVGIPLHVPISPDVVHELWDSLEGRGLDALRATWHRHRTERS